MHPLRTLPASGCKAILMGLPILFALVGAQSSHADILISPQRVIMSDSNRQAIISLHNPGSVSRTYRLEWVERRLTEDGELIAVEDGKNPRSAAAMLRFSPRRVSVEPGQTQTVRVDYRPPADLVPGEYRSHLRIALEPNPDGSSATEVMRGEEKGMSFRLDALLSFAVPVFVRYGAGTASSQLSAVAPTSVQRDGRSEPALKLTLTRSGEFSSYGRLMVYQQLTSTSPVELISETGGVALYTEVNEQSRVVTLKPGTQLVPGSWLRITYEGEGTERGQVFAERVFQIGK